MTSAKDPIHAGKRRFLRNAAASTAGLTALSMFPPAIRRALAIPANNRTGTINDVEHVVILMQENRSFDMYFGSFKGVRGFGGSSLGSLLLPHHGLLQQLHAHCESE